MQLEQGTARAIDGRGPYRAVFWRLIPFLMLCYIVAYIDRSNIGLAKLQFMHDLKMSEAVYGIAGGAFYLGYSLFGIPANLMLARKGARVSLFAIMVLWGIFSTGLAFVSQPGSFYALRFLVGAAEAGFLPGVLLYLSRWVPQSRRARFNALFLAAIPISGVIGGPLGGYVMHGFNSVGSFKGWQWMFILEGLPSCVLGLAVFLCLDERPEDARWLTSAEKKLIRQDLDHEGNSPVKRHISIWPAFRDRRFLALVAMAISAIVGSAAIGLWLPTILRQTGVVDVRSVGMLIAIPYAVAIFVQFLVARSSDRCAERRWHSAISIFVAAAGWALLPLVTHSAWLSVAIAIIIAAGTFAVTGPFWAMPTALLSGTAAAGGLAVITTFSGIAAFLSPLLVGWLSDRTHSMAAGEYYYAFITFAGGVTLLVGTRN
jgi:sugar phosphate permease